MGLLSKITKDMRSGVSRDHGRFEQSRKVEKAFESCRLPDDFNYYFSGPEAEPSAILGIHQDYTLRSHLWKEVDLTEAQLKAWVDEMNDHVDIAPMPRGFLMLDHRGKEIGIFYSPEKTKVRIEADNEIVVGVPKHFAKLEQGA